MMLEGQKTILQKNNRDKIFIIPKLIIKIKILLVLKKISYLLFTIKIK